jgi:hypothetical protein
VERSPKSRPGQPKGRHDTTNFPKGKVRRDRAGAGHVTKRLSRYVRLWPRKHQNALLHRFDSRRSTPCRLCFSALDMSAKVHAKLSPSDHLPSATNFKVCSHAAYFHVLEHFASRSYRSPVCPSQKHRSFDSNFFTFRQRISWQATCFLTQAPFSYLVIHLVHYGPRRRNPTILWRGHLAISPLWAQETVFWHLLEIVGTHTDNK